MRPAKLINCNSGKGKQLQEYETELVLKSIDRGEIRNREGVTVEKESCVDLDGDIVVDDIAFLDCLKAAGLSNRYVAYEVKSEKDQPALPWENPCPECGRPIPPRKPNSRGPSPMVCSDRCRKRKQRRKSKEGQ